MRASGASTCGSKVVAVGVVGTGEVEVAALEGAGLRLEQQVVDDAEPLDLFVGGDPRHGDVAVLGEERDVIVGRRELERRGRQRRQLGGHSGLAGFGLGLNMSRMWVKPTGW